MAVHLIAGGTAAIATGLALCADCGEDENQLEQELGEERPTMQNAAAMESDISSRKQTSAVETTSASARYRKRRSSVSFLQDDVPINRELTCSPFSLQESLSIYGHDDIDARSISSEHSPSLNVGSKPQGQAGRFLNPRSSLGSDVQDHSSVRLGQRTNSRSGSQGGFVDGNFATGKLLDLDISACYVMAFHPGDTSLLAVGLLDGKGVEIYETKSYSLATRIGRIATVSAMKWLAINCSTNSYSLLAVADFDGNVSLYRVYPSLIELRGCDLVHEFQMQDQVRALNLAIYGKLEKSIFLAAGDKGGSIIFNVYSMDSLHLLSSLESTHDSGILGLCTSDAASLIAVCTKGGAVAVHRVQRMGLSLHLGAEVWQTKRNGPVRAIVFSPSNQYLVYGGYDKSVAIVDIALWETVSELQFGGTIEALAFDPGDRFLAVGCRDKSFSLFCTSTFRIIKKIRTHDWVTCVSWASSAAGERNHVAIRTEPTCISILNLATIQQSKIKLSSGRGLFCSVSWSRDSRFLARTRGSRLLISDAHDLFSEAIEMDLKGPLKCVSFCQAKEMESLLAVVGSHGFLHVLQLRTSGTSVSAEMRHSRHIENDLSQVAWSADGELLALGGKKKLLHILETTDFTLQCEPIQLGGRIWTIDFVRESVLMQEAFGASTYGLAVGCGDNVVYIFDTISMQQTLRIPRARSVRCLAFHPLQPCVATGDSGNTVSIVNLFNEEVEKELDVGARVNSLCFSPTGDFLVVGTDNCSFSLHDTMTYQVLQLIKTNGFALTADICASGEYLVIGSAHEDYMVISLGPFLSAELVPIKEGVGALPPWALNEVIYRSGDGPSLLQRYMSDGSPESLQQAAALVSQYPDCIHTKNRLTGCGCFDTALELKKPNLLKLVLTASVNGSLVDGSKTILTSDMPERATEALNYMLRESPPDFIVDVLSKITFVKVPFTEPHEVSGSYVKERGSSSYKDPWERRPERKIERIGNQTELSFTRDKVFVNRTPAVLPIPCIGGMKFLSSLLYACPPTAFDNDAMGLVLRVMWNDHIRRFFLIDIALYLLYLSLWTALIDWTAVATSTTDNDAHKRTKFAIALALIVLNTLFAVKEVFQSRFGTRKGYFRSFWNIVDFLSIIQIYVYCGAALFWTNVPRAAAPLAVSATLLLTMKLLSYLRGFDSTGWLISVLVQNFKDVSGFIVVVVAILWGFTVSFRLLFANVASHCDLALTSGGTLEEECDVPSFSSIGRSLFTTFQLAVLGSYESSIFDESDHRLLAILTFVVSIICVLVVALNALIAVLSDSYARVQENAVANRRKERAELIVEYLSILPRGKRKEIEDQTKYFHALLESDEDGDLLINKDDWQGSLNALRKDLEHQKEHSYEFYRQEFEHMRQDLHDYVVALRRDTSVSLENLYNEVREVRAHQQEGGLTLNGRNVVKAVSVVKSIGRKGMFWVKNKEEN